MTKYEYKQDDFGRIKWVVISGRDYDIFDELTYNGVVPIGEIRPYIRSNTKQEIYDEIQSAHPKTYETLRGYTWFRDKYMKEKVVEVEYVEAVVDNETVGDLKQAIELLTERISTPTNLETQMIEAIIEKGKELSSEDLLEDAKNKLDEFIEKTYGSLPQRMTIVRNEVEYNRYFP